MFINFYVLKSKFIILLYSHKELQNLKNIKKTKNKEFYFKTYFKNHKNINLNFEHIQQKRE